MTKANGRAGALKIGAPPPPKKKPQEVADAGPLKLEEKGKAVKRRIK